LFFPSTDRPLLLRLCLGVAVWSLAGCLGGPSTVKLTYQHGSYLHKVSPVRIGVYYFDDDRPGWPAKAAMRMFDGPNYGGADMLHTEGEKAMSSFVTEALRAELAATGLRVSTTPEFDRLVTYATTASMSAAGVDRIVVGRINYFGVVGPVPKAAISPGAFAAPVLVLMAALPVATLPGVVALEYNRREQEMEGVSFDVDDVPSKAYVDLDLRVVEPSSGKILWARATRLKRNAGFLSGAVADTVAAFLADTLYLAFRDAIWRADFLAALGATVAPARGSAPAPATK
jgi:hypothetical protein